MLCKFMLFLAASVFFVLSVDAGAHTFSDDFDTPSSTDTHWDTVWDDDGDDWSHVTISGSDLGYRGVREAPNPVASSAADNSARYYNADLVLRVGLRLDDCGEPCQVFSEAGLFFSIYESD